MNSRSAVDEDQRVLIDRLVNGKRGLPVQRAVGNDTAGAGMPVMTYQ